MSFLEFLNNEESKKNSNSVRTENVQKNESQKTNEMKVIMNQSNNGVLHNI